MAVIKAVGVVDTEVMRRQIIDYSSNFESGDEASNLRNFKEMNYTTTDVWVYL